MARHLWILKRLRPLSNTPFISTLVKMVFFSGGVSIVSFLLCSVAYTDLLTMRDGREFECLIIAKSSETYCIKYLDMEVCSLKVETVRIDDVALVRKERNREIAKQRLMNSWNEQIKKNCGADIVDSSQEEEQRILAAKTEQFCRLDIGALNALFEAGNLTGEQKDGLWRQYRGKLVEWTGEVREVRETFGAVVVFFRHKVGARFYNVAARFPNCANPTIRNLNKGQTVVYTGKLLNRPGLLTQWEVGDSAVVEVISR